MKWTAEDRARHKAIREKFQKEKTSLQQLVESVAADPAMPLGRYVELRLALDASRRRGRQRD